MKGDRVLGVITKTTGRSYRVDIGSAMPASLPELAFEGATKRNKPNLQVLSLSSLSFPLFLSLSLPPFLPPNRSYYYTHTHITSNRWVRLCMLESVVLTRTWSQSYPVLMDRQGSLLVWDSYRCRAMCYTAPLDCAESK